VNFLLYLQVNPNGSYLDIAAVSNASGTIVGLMSNPEHAVEPLFGPDMPGAGGNGTDGTRFSTSILSAVVAA